MDGHWAFGSIHYLRMFSLFRQVGMAYTDVGLTAGRCSIAHLALRLSAASRAVRHTVEHLVALQHAARRTARLALG